MAGLSADTPKPVGLTLHAQSRRLEIEFNDGQSFALPFEFLRVHSPSAEVQGHGTAQAILQTGHRLVNITALEPVGHYAVRPQFSDGHGSGLFSWDYLHYLGSHQTALWASYLAALEAVGASRDG